MKKNGMHKDSDGTYSYFLVVTSASKTKKAYEEKSFKTRIECAYAYLKAVMKYDPKAAEVLKDLTADEQFKILGVNL